MYVALQVLHGGVSRTLLSKKVFALSIDYVVINQDITM